MLHILLTIDYLLSELPPTVGEEIVVEDAEDILKAAIQELPKLSKRSSQIRYGTVGEGPDLARLAWSQACQVFSLQRHNMTKELPHRPKTPELVPGRMSDDFLNRNPVEVLLIDEGDRIQTEYPIERWMEAASPMKRPRAVMVFGHAKRMIQEES